MLLQHTATFRERFNQGQNPVDGRQPLSDELALAMVSELTAAGVAKDALIGVVDAFLILSTHLKDAGFTNLVLLESLHKDLTPSQDKYYNAIKTICGKSGIEYYVPPMNNYNRCDMKFDVIIGNPPYQQASGGGSQRGSAVNPLWWEFTNKAINLLKEDGILSFVTPQNIVNGGDLFTGMVLGPERKYDLKTVDFSADEEFKVGTDICRWVLTNSLTEGNTVEVNDGRVLDTDKTIKINTDAQLDDILNALMSYEGDKFDFGTKGQYHNGQVKTFLKKNNLPQEWSSDFSEVQTEDYQYPININGKVKFIRFEWKNYGTWRVFYPQLQSPAKITVDDKAVASPATLTMPVSSEEEGNKVAAILSDARYRWVVNSTRQAGRVTWILSKFPNAPIEEVLSAEQLSYIDSHL